METRRKLLRNKKMPLASPSDSKKKHNKKMETGRKLLQNKKRPLASPSDSKKKVVFNDTGSSRSSKKKRASASDYSGQVRANSPAMERAEEIQANLEPKFPSMIKFMLPSHVTGGFWLGLPKHFCVLHMPSKDTEFILEDETGEEFKTKYLTDKIGLSGGWRGFSIMHNLIEGDVVVFQLVKPTKFKVFIVRSNSLDDADGDLGLLNLEASVTQLGYEDSHNKAEKGLEPLPQDTPKENVQKDTQVVLETNENCSDDLDSELEEAITGLSESIINFKEVNTEDSHNKAEKGLEPLPQDTPKENVQKDTQVVLETNENCSDDLDSELEEAITGLSESIINFKEVNTEDSHNKAEKGLEPLPQDTPQENVQKDTQVVLETNENCSDDLDSELEEAITGLSESIINFKEVNTEDSHNEAEKGLEPLPQDTPQENVQKDTQVVLETNENCSDDLDSELEEAIIGLSESIINFKEVNSLENFTVSMHGLIIDSVLLTHVRAKYYELCHSQNSYLHENLLEGLNCTLAAGIISETVNIADAIKACKVSTPPEHISTWDKTLKAFEGMGMNVGFLRAKLKKLLSIGSESKRCREASRERVVKADEEMRKLQDKLLQIREAAKRLDAEIENLTVTADWHDIMFQQEVDAPW